MKHAMRKIFPILFSLFLLHSAAIADAGLTEPQIDRACLRHAVSLVARLKSESSLKMDQAQSEQALALATESCQAYFKKEFMSEAAANEIESGSDEVENDKDWFTEHILSGDTERKKGNERLKKLKRH